MSDQTMEHAHPQISHVAETHHPTAYQYIVVAIILTILTLAEIGVYSIQFLQPVLVPLLLFFSFWKFVLVAGFYMHLRFDSRVFSVLFIFPLLLGGLILGALIMLLSYLAHHPGP